MDNEYGFTQNEVLHIYGHFKKYLNKSKHLKGQDKINSKSDIKFAASIVAKMENRHPSLKELPIP